MQSPNIPNLAAPAAPFPLQLTVAALNRLEGVLPEYGATILRVHVQGGGCSGFSYGFAPEQELQADDLVQAFGSISVVVDPMSASLMQGGTLAWEESLHDSRFVVYNPNATATCGCGSSFSA
jgi:iron-sulfur cluster insertion protein